MKVKMAARFEGFRAKWLRKVREPVYPHRVSGLAPIQNRKNGPKIVEKVVPFHLEKPVHTQNRKVGTLNEEKKWYPKNWKKWPSKCLENMLKF
jgi:hypothetical protein